MIKNSEKIVIDLTGPNGNAFVLLSYVKSLGIKLSFDKDKISKIQEEMMEGDYENLLNVFDSYFGEYVTLYR